MTVKLNEAVKNLTCIREPLGSNYIAVWRRVTERCERVIITLFRQILTSYLGQEIG
jgi:hypothetical protein